MKTLKDISSNITSLKTALCEGILVGQDETIKAGDNIVAEFDILKRSAQNKKNWILYKQSGPGGRVIRNYKLFVAKDLPALCGMFGVKNPKTLNISAVGQSGGWTLWIACVNDSNKSEFSFPEHISIKYGTPFAKMHKEEICPLFDDFDKFVEFVKSNIKIRYKN
jgi:hypothetical protein